MPLKIGILGSTKGTSTQLLIDTIKAKLIDAEISIVISNVADAFILQRAQNNAIKSVFLSPTGLKRETFDEKVSQLLKQEQVDVVLCVGYMRILSAKFVQDWRDKIVNVHPSLLPEFKGGMDLNVHQAVLEAQKKESGCTVHLVTEAVDEGPILVQKRCAVSADDSAESLKEKVQELEKEAIVEVVRRFIEEKRKENTRLCTKA